jgi:Rad3-related DNA helicase
MAGRLIRSEEDRGIVVIVDARPEKSYFRRLSEAFPGSSGVQVCDISQIVEVLSEVGASGPSADAPPVAD